MNLLACEVLLKLFGLANQSECLQEVVVYSFDHAALWEPFVELSLDLYVTGDWSELIMKYLAATIN